MRFIMPVLVWLACVSPAVAQTPFNVKTLPAEIRALKWKEADFEGASLVERCRALDLLNDALDAIRDQLAADADLMSQFIDDNDLGGEFVARPPEQGPAVLTFSDGQKVALTLLRGPMASSIYSKALEGAPDDQLRAFANMNMSSGRWKWEEMADRRDRVLAMSHFLKGQKKQQEYEAWVPGEIDRRAAERKAAMDEKKRAAAEKSKEQSQRAQEIIKQRQEQDEQAKREQSAGEMQQAMAAAQDVQTTGGTVVVDDDDSGYWYYGGLAARRGAELYRDAAYRGAATAATDRRMSSWHRGGGGGRRGGGRR